VRGTLDVWPPLPLCIQWQGNNYRTRNAFITEGVDNNIIAVLEHSDRVCRIDLMDVPNPYLGEIWAAVRGPFFKLIHLRLISTNISYGDPIIPESFLGGFAPCLQFLWLKGIVFPGVRRLLLSATHLVDLCLRDIPHFGYISPEAMATTVSALTCLRRLILGFRSPQSFPDQESQRPPPLTRSVLPALTNFTFEGVSDYLEYLVALIDVPRLNKLHITFFNQIIFDTPQFIQFVNRTPNLKTLEKAHVTFGGDAARVSLSSALSLTSGYGELYMKISCIELDWQVSSLEQVCTSFLLPFSTLQDLYIHKVLNSRPDWQDNVENALWLELLKPFTTVKNLYLCEEFAPRIMRALQELVGGRTTEVLPTLQNIFFEELQLSGPVQESIREFVAARQVTSYPIAVSRWVNSLGDKLLTR
jgi:hypothetical protein